MKRKIIPIIIILIMVVGAGLCYYLTLPVQSKSEEVNFKINEKELPKTVIKNLKDEGLIKNEQFTYIYVKINNLDNLVLEGCVYEESK